MKIVPYTENGNCYLLSNFASSNNPLFTSKEEIEDFKKRVLEYLGFLVEILAYSFHSDHFQIVLVLKDRKTYEDFYRDKKKDQALDGVEIPESTYILSQEMSNLQSGYAKMFNNKYNRFGSLFGRRYTKLLLETSDEVEKIVNEINSGKLLWDFDRLWSFIYNFIKREFGFEKIVETTKVIYDGGCVAIGAIFPGFLHYQQWNLRGSYVPKRLKC